MNVFVDNCLAQKHATALHALVEPNHQVVHLRTKFKPDTPDEEWLSILGKEGGWIVISGDTRISRNLHEREAWHASNLPLMEQHSKLSHCLPEILKTAEKAPAGSGFLVSVNGKIEQIYPQGSESRGS